MLRKVQRQLYFLIIIAYLQSTVLGQNLKIGSCSKIVVIESTEVYNYLANVTFLVPSPHQGVWGLTLTTDEPFAFFGGWGLKIEIDERTHSFVKLTSLKPQNLKTGDKISFRFRLYWNRNETTWPKVKSIIWENRLICETATRKKKNLLKSKKNQSVNSISKYKYLN